MAKKGNKYAIHLADSQVKRWIKNLERGSPVTAEVALRRIGKSSELLGLNPKGIVEKAKKDPAVFQGMLEDVVGKLENENKSPGYIVGLVEAIKSWLRYNDVTLGEDRISSKKVQMILNSNRSRIVVLGTRISCPDQLLII